jgi:hypothetical protein
MKFGLLVALFILSFCRALHANDIDTDKSMWVSAYNGNFSLVHKMILMREREEINDKILNQFALAYVYYRACRYDEIEAIFKCVDGCIERSLLEKNK